MGNQDGRVVGIVAATGTIVALWFVALGLFTSLGGLVIAAMIAAWIGTTVATVVDRRFERNVAAVAAYVAVLVLAYLMLGQSMSRHAPLGLPGSSGGLGVMPPVGR